MHFKTSMKTMLALFAAVLVVGFAFAARTTKAIWQGEAVSTAESEQRAIIDLSAQSFKAGDKLTIYFEKAGVEAQTAEARPTGPMRTTKKFADIQLFEADGSTLINKIDNLTGEGTVDYTFEADKAGIQISGWNLTITKVELEAEAGQDDSQQKTVNGITYAVKSENLFVNGSFDDGVAGWKTVGYTTDAVAENFILSTEGGYDGGAYITTNGAGVGSENTIRQSVAVTQGKTYYFAVRTSGKAPAANNFNYNALFKMTDATTENGVIKAFEWPQGADQTATEWSITECVFTAETDFVGVRMGWNSSSSFDGFELYEVEQLTSPLDAAKATKIAAIEALGPIGEGLFFYSQADIDAAKAAVNAAQTVEEVEAVAMPTPKAPDANKTYSFQLRLDGETPLYMSVAEGGIKIEEAATALKFIADETAGQYFLANEDETLFVGLAGGNNWTMSALPEKKAAWTFTVLADGAYRINNLVTVGRFVGTNSDEKTAGSPCYADKLPSNGNVDWIIAEAAGDEADDYTNYIVNADLTGNDGWDTEGTKGYHSVGGVVTAGNNAQFNFKQTIANLPAGQYKLTAQAAYRYGVDEATEAAAIAAGTETKFASLYATVGAKTVSSLVQNRYDGASTTDYANGNGSVVVNEMFVPNSTAAIKAWFTAGQYVNEVVFNLLEAGDVTIGIVKMAQPEAGDYTVIGPWTLTRLGDAEAEEEPAIEPGTDMTKYIVNPSFETGDLTGWTVGNSSDTGVKPNSNATYTTEGIDGEYLFNTWWQGIPITQTISGLPNGKYELKALMANDAITAGNKPCLYLLANGEHSEAFSSANAGVFAEGSMQFYVTNGTATIGALGGNADGSFTEAGYYWYKADNFRLTFVEALPNIEDIEIPEGKMSQAAANDLAAAQESGDAVTLLNAVKAAKESIEAYAHLKAVLDELDNVLANTNVYTAEAKETFDEAYNTAKNGYDEGTTSDADAKAFNYGSRLDGMLPSLLLSAWTSTVSGTPYINTWSTEGNNDGSDFRTPFYEYWVADGESLGANTISAELTNLEAGEYEVTALVRVRIKNGAEAPATGITMQVNEGEAVAIAGEQIGTSQLYLQEYTVAGTVGEDGKLKITLDVAAENNVSWLSFKNVNCVKKGAEPQPEEGVLYSWESPEGTPVETGGTISYENAGDVASRLNYKNGDFYTICLNGKKGNMNDETPSTNAGYMLVTLDNALNEGDKIEITAYINKNTSAKASAWVVFETEATADSGDFGDEANINEAFNGVQATKTIEVLSDAAGSKWFKMTRGTAGTNLFITKLQVLKNGSTNGIDTMTVQRGNDAIYNLSGQKVMTAKKGLYIINGKKVMVK